MFAYRGVDYMEIDGLFSDQEKLVRQTVREFVEKEVIPHIEGWNREGKFPMHLVPLMAELGFFGANMEGYGCAGMSNVEYGLIMQELERGDSGLRSFVSVQGALVMYPIKEYGSEEQRQRWLPALQSGRAVGCFGLTEPDFGSNPGGMRTRAVKDRADYVLNGEKAWITSGTIADVAVVWARTDEGIRGFLVEKGTQGYTAKDIKGKWSLRASVTSNLSLADVRVPTTAMLPGAQGLKAPLRCLTQARYGIGWGAIGAAMACYHESLEYAKVRRQFGDKPIAGHQLGPGRLCPHLYAEAEQRGYGAPDGPRRTRHSGSERRRRRISHFSPPVQPRVSVHLRGYSQHPHAHHWRASDRSPGLRVSRHRRSPR
jgi:glutaryl-CoA dehydrogenase